MQVFDDRFQAESGWNSTTCFNCLGVIIRLACKTYIVVVATLMTALGRNMLLSELFHKVMFDGYLYIAYFIVKHNGMHNFRITNSKFVRYETFTSVHKHLGLACDPLCRR
jgi:hypothetical protein